MTGRPQVSVVIPVRNRAGVMDQVLERLARQRGVGQGDVEVVVADDGSSDDLESVVARHVGTLDVRRVQAGDGITAWAAGRVRNRGIESARGEIVLMLDADILAGPFLVARHLERHRQTAGLLLAGAVLGYPFAPAERAPDRMGAPPIDELVDRIPELLLADPARWRDCRMDLTSAWPELVDSPFPWVWMWSGHLSCARAALLEAGGFEAAMTGWGGEDIDLAYRLWRAGLLLRYDTRAWGVHVPHGVNYDPDAFAESLRSLVARHACPIVEIVVWSRGHFSDRHEDRRAVARRLRVALCERERPTALTASDLQTGLERAGLGDWSRLAWFGASPVGLAASPAVHCRPFEAPATGGSHAGPCFLGLYLPWDAHRHDDAVVVDYWAMLDRETVVDLAAELCRIARRAHFAVAGDAAAVERLAGWLQEAGFDRVVRTTAGGAEIVSAGGVPGAAR